VPGTMNLSLRPAILKISSLKSKPEHTGVRLMVGRERAIVDESLTEGLLLLEDQAFHDQEN
jgi:hypothetical protein